MRGFSLLFGAVIFMTPVLVSPALADARLDAALCEAAQTGTPDQIKALVRQGAGLGAVCGQDSPLSYATLADRLDNMATLIDAGADVNLAGEKEYSAAPLFRVKSAEAAQFLIDHGADANARNHENDTPLLEVGSSVGYSWVYASVQEAGRIAEVLLDHGADVNAADKDGFTTLWHAVLFPGVQPFVAMLLDRGADPNIRVQPSNNTPLDGALITEKNAADIGNKPQDYRDYEDLLRAHGGVE